MTTVTGMEVKMPQQTGDMPSAPQGGYNFGSELQFTNVLGVLPLQEPNVHTVEDIFTKVNKGVESPNCSLSNALWSSLCCATGVGCCYVLGKMVLVNEGDIGFTMENGKPGILTAGRHFLGSPLKSLVGIHSLSENLIKESPITIVRIPKGSLGFGMNGSEPEILLPGLHLRNNSAFIFHQYTATTEEKIEYGPIKIFTVKTGSVRVCYSNGRIQIFKEGRYAVNSATFSVGNEIETQQQNLRFDKHPVLLDGGITLLVEGLLTYQVTDVERLINQLGERDLLHSIQDCAKAELARVFAALHLEQISSATFDANEFKEGSTDEAKAEPESLLGKEIQSHEGETRMWICQQVIRSLSPIAAAWGVKIINFQLESTKIADDNYAKEYEAASLAMAKAKANLRATQAQNQITLTSARATANALKIEAEGKKAALIIEAEAAAEARKIEAHARNDAANSMKDDFARKLMLANQQVEFARSLKATSLTVIPSSGLGRNIISQPMFAEDGK